MCVSKIKLIFMYIELPLLLDFSLLLLLLSRFSCVRLCVTPQMAAQQAPPSLGFSRQEYIISYKYWVGQNIRFLCKRLQQCLVVFKFITKKFLDCIKTAVISVCIKKITYRTGEFLCSHVNNKDGRKKEVKMKHSFSDIFSEIKMSGGISYTRFP